MRGYNGRGFRACRNSDPRSLAFCESVHQKVQTQDDRCRHLIKDICQRCHLILIRTGGDEEKWPDRNLMSERFDDPVRFMRS